MSRDLSYCYHLLPARDSLLLVYLLTDISFTLGRVHQEAEVDMEFRGHPVLQAIPDFRGEQW